MRSDDFVLAGQIKEVQDEVSDFVQNGSAESDLDIADDYDNVVMRLSEGHVKTKNFDSRDFKTFVGDEDNADLDFSDEQGNVVMRVANGHVRTKKFDSSTVLTRADLDTLYNTLRALNHPLHGKKVGFLGDSITYGYGLTDITKRYPTVFCNLVGCTERNLGVNGSCIATSSIRGAEGFVERVTSANIADLDYLFIFGGTNDFTFDVKGVGEHFIIEPISVTSDFTGDTKLSPNTDTETFSGGIHNLVAAIRTIKPTLRMCFITPLNRGRKTTIVSYRYNGRTYTGDRPSSEDSNMHGNYLYEYVNAIVDIANYYAIPVIKLGDIMGIDPVIDDGVYFQDNLHPNAAGANIIANLLFNWTLTNVIF